MNNPEEQERYKIPAIEQLVEDLPLRNEEKLLLDMRISQLILTELAKQQERDSHNGRFEL